MLRMSDASQQTVGQHIVEVMSLLKALFGKTGVNELDGISCTQN